MNIKLDKKDIKIIYYLFQDARISIPQLAKKVELSQNAIKNRIKRLEKEEILEGFTTIVNLDKINLTSFLMLIEFNDDIYNNPELIDFFKKHKFVNWSAILSGKWDILAEFIIYDLNHRFIILKELLDKFGPIINNFQIFHCDEMLKIEHLIEDIYSDIEIKKSPKKPTKKNIKNYKIDNIDKKIISFLTNNANQSYVNIAYKLNLTIDIIRYRIKKLKENNIIQGFIPLLNINLLNYNDYIHILKIKYSSHKDIEKIKKSIKNNKNITYAFFDISTSSIIFSSAYKNIIKIDNLTRDLKKEFGSIIYSYEFFLIPEQIAFNLFPDGLLEKNNF